MFTFAEAETALCIWEHILKSTYEAGSRWCRIREHRNGANGLRQDVLIHITRKVEAAWDHVSEDYNDAFDWEFIPDLLESLDDPIHASFDDYIEAAREIIR